jgi:hypothetical protein
LPAIIDDFLQTARLHDPFVFWLFLVRQQGDCQN